MLPVTILNIVAIVAASIFAGITVWRNPDRFALSYVIIIPISMLLYYLYGTSMPLLVMVLSTISAKYLYSRVFFFFAPIIFAIGTALMYLAVSPPYWSIYDLSIGLGTAIALFTDKQSMQHVMANNNSKGISKTREIRRDFLQIAGGILILAVLFASGQKNFVIGLSLAVIPLYMFGNYFSLLPNSRIGKTLSSFERPTTPLGLGAIWFAAGIMIAIGVVNSVSILAIIVFVTTIGDPLATISGTMIHSPKLPYNRKKSVAGFLGIFIFSGIFGFILLGYTGLFLALVSAILESISVHPLDDNFIIPVILSAISYAL